MVAAVPLAVVELVAALIVANSWSRACPGSLEAFADASWRGGGGGPNGWLSVAWAALLPLAWAMPWSKSANWLSTWLAVVSLELEEELEDPLCVVDAPAPTEVRSWSSIWPGSVAVAEDPLAVVEAA